MTTSINFNHSDWTRPLSSYGETRLKAICELLGPWPFFSHIWVKPCILPMSLCFYCLVLMWQVPCGYCNLVWHKSHTNGILCLQELWMSPDDKGMTLWHLSHNVITAASFIHKVSHKCCSMRTFVWQLSQCHTFVIQWHPQLLWSQNTLVWHYIYMSH